MSEPDANPSSSPDETPLPAEIDEYLRRLGAGLDLPVHVRAEIASEMEDHFRDSIAAIESEGLDGDRAAREAIARLGNPTELAAELTSAHRTTRRLLAGAAGGVFHATLGAAGGLLLGIAIVAAALCASAVVTGTLLRPPTEFVFAGLPALRAALAGLPMVTALLAWACCVAAFVAARRGVAVSRCHRRPTNGHGSSRMGLLSRGVRRRPPGSGRLDPNQPAYAGRGSAHMGDSRLCDVVRGGRLRSVGPSEPSFGLVTVGRSVRVRHRRAHQLDASSFAPA